MIKIYLFKVCFRETMECKVPVAPPVPDVSWTLDMQPYDNFHFSKFNLLYAGKKSGVWSAVYCGDRAAPLVGAEPGSRVCVKSFMLSEMSPSEMTKLRREIAFLVELDHPNIVRGHGAFCSRRRDAVCIVTSYCANGDLCDIMAKFKSKCVPDATVNTKIINPLLLALAYLHGKDIMHRDLKPENVVVSSDGTIVLCDFGLAINFVQDTPVSRIGTLQFMAPEVVALEKKTSEEAERLRAARLNQYTENVDVWAMGCLVFELLHGRALFCGETDEEIELSILAAELTFPRRMAAHTTVSQAAVDFMAACLIRNPLERPSVNRSSACPLGRHPAAYPRTKSQLQLRHSRGPSAESKTDDVDAGGDHSLIRLLPIVITCMVQIRPPPSTTRPARGQRAQKRGGGRAALLVRFRWKEEDPSMPCHGLHVMGFLMLITRPPLAGMGVFARRYVPAGTCIPYDGVKLLGDESGGRFEQQEPTRRAAVLYATKTGGYECIARVEDARNGVGGRQLAIIVQGKQ